MRCDGKPFAHGVLVATVCKVDPIKYGGIGWLYETGTFIGYPGIERGVYKIVGYRGVIS